jgi:hypothetical protein
MPAARPRNESPKLALLDYNSNDQPKVHCQLGVRDADAIRENPSKYPSPLNVF